MSKKKSGFLGTGIAAVCVLGIAGYAYIVEFKQRDAKELQKEKDALVVQLEKEKLTRIEFHRNSGPLIMESAGGTWKLVEPVSDSVDTTEVDGLLNAVLGEKSQEVVVEGDSIDWKTYGLDQPVTRLVAKTADQTREVKIGSVKSFDGALYARLGDESKVLLVNQSWDAHLSKLVKDVRDKRLLRSDLGDFDTVSIRRAGGANVKMIKKDGVWSFASGGDNSLPISSDLVQSYIEKIKNMRSVDFAAENKEAADAGRFGTKGSGLVGLELSTAGKAVFSMSVSRVKPSVAEKTTGQDESHRYAVSSDSPLIFKIFKTNAEDIDRGPEAFYDKKFPFRLTTADVTNVEVLHGEIKFRAKLTDGTWTLDTPDEKNDLVSEKVQDLVDRVAKLEVAKFRGKVAGQGLTPADRVIRLADKDGKLLLQVNWGAVYTEKGEGSEIQLVDAKTNLSDQTFAVNDYLFTGLPFKDLLKEKGSSASLATKPSETETKKAN